MKKKIIKIFLSRKGCSRIHNGQAIYRDNGNVMYPIAYIKKAKHATEEEYWEILNSVFKPDIA